MRTRRHRAIMWAEQGCKKKVHNKQQFKYKNIDIETVRQNMSKGINNYFKAAFKAVTRILGGNKDGN
ncbi:hypothetical protein AB4G91_01435 [Macrococcoides goetzii]|uniref:hypothetical protein n=1 Tax=Macrococcus sp. PK TaxID=2801919 RepID=UPI001F0E16FA|nr:hypothetical protein [Macrococcus sp. PK]MCH4983959.1 hypothetical protein [Macrococcus sp. PK]